MKILWIYNYSQQNTYNQWYTGDFMVVLNQLPDIEMRCYGLNMHKLYPNLTIIPYDEELTMQDLKMIYDFDIVILISKIRYFDSEDQTWLPKDFNFFHCPKILIEGDYFKFRKQPWFHEAKFDLILHRHKTNVIRGEEDFPYIKQLWYPVSVDNKIFQPNSKIKRIKKLCYLGSQTWHYFYRNKAMVILKEHDLINIKPKTKTHYIDYLQSYISHLNGSSIYSIDNAKAFEIISAGSILLTNKCYNGFPELFDNNYFTYNNDFSDLVDKAKFIINNYDQCFEIIANGFKIINDKHTHLIRAQELIDIINREIKAFRPPIIIEEKPSWIDNIGFLFGFDKKIESIPSEISSEPIIEKSKEESNSYFIDSKLSIEDNNYNYLKFLKSEGYRICLLKETCYEAIMKNNIAKHLNIGIDNIPNQTIESVTFEKIPTKTKAIKLKDLVVEVPFPVVKYLEQTFKKSWKELQNGL